MTYQPSIQIPTDITKAENAVVTTEENHDYVVGQRIKFKMPNGMTQINDKIGTVTATTDDTLTTNIDTRGFNDFVASAASDADFNQVIPIGDKNFGFVYDGGDPLNRVKGSFTKV